MTELSPSDLALIACAAAGTVWAVLPPLMTALGVVLLRYSASEDPADAEPTGDDPDYERRVRQLGSLGFRPIGSVTERVWLYGIDWFKASRIRCLATPDGQCFAALFRLTPGEPVRIALKTFLTGGGMVTTAMPGAGLQQDGATSSRIELQGVAPAELLARHREHVERFARERGLEVVRATLADYATADAAHDRQTLREVAGGGFLLLVALFFAGPAAVCLFAWRGLGTDSGPGRGVAGALCVGTAVYAALTKAIIPALFRRACAVSHAPGAGEE
jgi:hypothetical protein